MITGKYFVLSCVRTIEASGPDKRFHDDSGNMTVQRVVRVSMNHAPSAFARPWASQLFDLPLPEVPPPPKYLQSFGPCNCEDTSLFQFRAIENRSEAEAAFPEGSIKASAE